MLMSLNDDGASCSRRTWASVSNDDLVLVGGDRGAGKLITMSGRLASHWSYATTECYYDVLFQLRKIFA